MLAGTILAIANSFIMHKVDDPADITWIAALAVLAVADELEVPLDVVREAIAGFHGVQRRFTIVGTPSLAKNGKKGDVIHLDFAPGTGTQVVFNGKPRGKPIAGDDFYRVLLRIWLGDSPVDTRLKRAMLGGG